MKTRSHAANTSRSLPSRVMAVLLSAVLFCTGLSLGSFASAEELPVLETDVSQASSGNLLIGIQGTYIDQISEALDLINSYRLEACQNGYPTPAGSGRGAFFGATLKQLMLLIRKLHFTYCVLGV